MKFNHITFKNFLSYGDDLYTIPLSEPGITLLTGENQKDGGSNGSGKSTAVVDSIVYALFGQTTKGLKAEEIVNNKNKTDCYVEISFDINQDTYLIRRYRQHFEFGNKLVFEKNGTDISSEKIRETQDLIESTIKIGYRSFVQSIVLSQESVANFAKADPIERRKIIENILMFEFISKYHKASKEILRKINPEIESLTNSFGDKKDMIKTLGDNLLKYVDKWESDEANKIRRIQELKKSLEAWKHIDIDKERSVREDIREKTREREALTFKKESIEEDVSRATGNLQKLKSNLRAKSDEIDEINKNPESCPVCGSKIKDGIFKDYLDKRLAEKSSLEEEISGHETAIKDWKDGVKTLIKKLDAKAVEITTLRSLISADLKDEEIQNISQKITQAESEISVLQSQNNKTIEEDEYIKNTQKKIDQIREESKEIKLKIAKLNEDKSHYEWWKDALGNSPNSLRTFCVNHVLKSLNKYINYYLEFFGYDIHYTLDVELLDSIIKDGETVSFAQLSGGEKRSVEISLVFALYEIVKLKMPDNINIIVLDELLSLYLDDVRISGALEILNELEERKLSIFVIDHKNLIKENLDCRIINVIKDGDGFSSLEIVS